MIELNENQKVAAGHVDGPMMVLAGPGSGKTAVITARALNLATTLADPRKILVITFSKAAASEMEKRFRTIAPKPAPPVAFGTFHSMFFRILRNRNGYSLDKIISDAERKSVIRSSLKGMKYDLDDEHLLQVIGEMSLMRNELLDIEAYNALTIGADHFRAAFNSYEAYKKEKSLIDFDDMLVGAYNIFANGGDELNYWRNCYKYIMIDEFQDINNVQYKAVKLLAAPSNNLFVVGDDDQSIYRFRGSRPEFLLNFPKDFPETQQITLSVNYRSTDSVIRHANCLIAHNKLRYSKGIVGTTVKGPDPVFITSTDQNHEAVRIGEIIRKLWKNGANLDEIAICFRQNIQARAFIDAFINMNIPFKSRDEIPTLYEHWIAEDMFAYLRVARKFSLQQKLGFDPDELRIVNKPFRYIPKVFLLSLKQSDKSVFAAYRKDQKLHLATKTAIEDLHFDLLRLAKFKTVDALRYLRRGMGYDEHIAHTAAYRKLQPSGLMEIADELVEAAKVHDDPFGFIAHAKAATEAAKKKDITGPCCILTTLHSAKGLEFERVFIAGLNEEVLPSHHSKTGAEIEEERRLLYVGITRAKHELYLSDVEVRYDKPVKKSRFLDEIRRSK